MSDVIINNQQVFQQIGLRPREGTTKGPDGFADADMDLFVSFSVGVTKAGGGLLDKDGNARGVLVTVGGFSRPLSEVRAEARQMLGLMEQQAEAPRLVSV